MRAILVGSLLTVLLLFLFTSAASSQSRLLSASERRDAPRTVELKVKLENRNSWGTSEHGARQNVLKKAEEVLADWLRKQSPYYSFKPTTEFIEKELLRKTDGTDGVFTKHEDDVDVGNGEKHKLYSAQVVLYLTPEVQDKLRREAEGYVVAQRAHEAWSRQWPLFKGLLFIVAMAAAVGGYFNLDDRTQGYYSNPLRIVAAAVVVAAGYAITLLP